MCILQLFRHVLSCSVGARTDFRANDKQKKQRMRNRQDGGNPLTATCSLLSTSQVEHNQSILNGGRDGWRLTQTSHAGLRTCPSLMSLNNFQMFAAAQTAEGECERQMGACTGSFKVNTSTDFMCGYGGNTKVCSAQICKLWVPVWRKLRAR